MEKDISTVPERMLSNHWLTAKGERETFTMEKPGGSLLEQVITLGITSSGQSDSTRLLAPGRFAGSPRTLATKFSFSCDKIYKTHEAGFLDSLPWRRPPTMGNGETPS